MIATNTIKGITLVLALETRVGEFAAESEPGVVNEDFDRDVLVVQKVVDRLRSIEPSQINGEDLYSGAVFSLQLTRRRFERIALA